MLELGYPAAVVLFFLLAITTFAWRITQLRLRKIQQEKDDIVGEEMRMFDFLHHIGEAIEKDITPAQLYKEIVEGFGDLIIQREIIDSTVAISGACQNSAGHIISSKIAAKVGYLMKTKKRTQNYFPVVVWCRWRRLNELTHKGLAFVDSQNPRHKDRF